MSKSTLAAPCERVKGTFTAARLMIFSPADRKPGRIVAKWRQIDLRGASRRLNPLQRLSREAWLPVRPESAGGTQGKGRNSPTERRPTSISHCVCGHVTSCSVCPAPRERRWRRPLKCRQHSHSAVWGWCRFYRRRAPNKATVDIFIFPFCLGGIALLWELNTKFRKRRNQIICMEKHWSVIEWHGHRPILLYIQSARLFNNHNL